MVPLLAGPTPPWLRPMLRRLAVVAAGMLAVLLACWWW
jgi:hypothetical protein